MQLKEGDKVMVKNTTIGGCVVKEGAAKLISYLGYDDMWIVEFFNEPDYTYPRFVQFENKL